MKQKAMKKGCETAAGLIRNLPDVLVSVYMVLILVVMPFYFTDGYGRIGTNKYEFFYAVTTGMGKVFLPVLAVYLLVLLRGCSRIQRKVSLTDWCALGYGAVLVLSYIHTDYREMTPYGDAWKGSNGWYMGLSTQLLFLAVYFAVSRFWKPKKWILFLGILAQIAVFFLGYCNRFGIYPIEMEYAQPSYISTIGNINWFCGYVVTVLFGVLYYWWSGEAHQKAASWVMTIYVVLGLAALVTQGSNSGILALLVMLVVFYLLSVKEKQRMQQFFKMLVLLTGVCSLTALLRYTFPDAFTFREPVTDMFTFSWIPVIVLVESVFICCLMRKISGYPQKFFVAAARIGVCAGALLIVVLIGAIVVNTLVPGSLGKLSEKAFFTFNEQWGSHRGATYMAGAKVWSGQDFLGKLIGVGPDCMAMYIHMGSSTDLQTMVKEIWGPNIMLTNAHCEWLTILVNAGILGLFCFGGMIISAVIRFVKAGKRSALAAACGISILAYTVHNVVSFQQTMATATMFLILGIGEAYIRATASQE